MIVRVLLFAALREAVGRSRCECDVPSGASIADVLATLRRDHPSIATARFAVARNRTYAREDELLADGDELALIPPVSGG